MCDVVANCNYLISEGLALGTMMQKPKRNAMMRAFFNQLQLNLEGVWDCCFFFFCLKKVLLYDHLGVNFIHYSLDNHKL